MSARIVFFGNERLATGVTTTAPTLRALLAAGYDVAAVVTQHDTSQGSRKPRELEIAAVAAEYNVPVLLPNRMADIADQLHDYGAEVGVLVAFGKIIPQSVIDLFPKGIINIHPSALPLHRGPTPLESVILRGETQTAVSLMALAAAMDAGPVYAQRPVTLVGNESKQVLADQLLGIGRDMVLEHLPAILADELPPIAQHDQNATYDNLITKQAGVIDWQQPAIVIARQIRAYAGWPRSRTTIGDRDVIVTAAHAIAGPNDMAGILAIDKAGLAMHTGEGILVIDELIPAGKKPMTGQAFLAGYSPLD